MAEVVGNVFWDVDEFAVQCYDKQESRQRLGHKAVSNKQTAHAVTCLTLRTWQAVDRTRNNKKQNITNTSNIAV